MIGETIGNFEIVARIGRGGMGEVFLAQQRSIETKVAIKVLQPEISHDKDHVRRFFNEARAVSKIKHAGITKIFDVGFHDRTGHAYLIMEYLEGESLGARLARNRRIPLPKLVDIGRQISSVLDATHAVGIIHRDLKPDNIFLIPDLELEGGERVKILDFGIAKLTDTANGPRTIGTMGTPTYMAPEQWGDSAHVDWRADQYSLGCVVYEMATGQPPFNATSIPELYAQHLTMAPPTIAEVVNDMPQALDQLVFRMLQKNPAARFESMRELVKRFETMSTRSSSPFATTKPGPVGGVAAPLPAAPVDRVSEGEHASTHNTTLSRVSAWVAGRRASADRLVPIALLSAIAVVIAMIVAVAVHKKHQVAAQEQQVAQRENEVVATDAPAVAQPDAAAKPIELPWNEWIASANPFVTAHGISVMSHQITRAEYRHYLVSLPTASALKEQPGFGWDETAPEQPVAWVSQERAVRFCASIKATLPTSEQFTTLAAGAWGLDPTGKNNFGPLKEWTASVKGGLATVRGAEASMPPAMRDTWDHDHPQQKEVEAGALDVKIMDVAGKEIGFRCVR
ncbi:MAG: serine/threonine-protein kinase [Kofleriaceae bacterium]